MGWKIPQKLAALVVDSKKQYCYLLIIVQTLSVVFGLRFAQIAVEN